MRREERFEAAACAHLRSLYGTACRLTRNAQDAEDLVQETCLRAYRSFDSYSPGTNARAWLFTILYRARIDSVRKSGRAPRTTPLPDDEPGAPPPQEALADGHEEVARALDALPEPLHAAVVLRDVEDLTYEEIAQALDIPIATVMSRIHHGRDRVRAALRQGAPTHPASPQGSRVAR